MKNGYRFSVENKVMTGNNILILNPDIATTYVQRAIIFQRVVVCFKHGLIVKGLVDKKKVSHMFTIITTTAYTVGFPLIWAVLRPTHGSLPIDPLIDLPKGFS